MPEIEVINKESTVTGRIVLPDEIFSVEVRKDILHQVAVNYLANQRQGTAATKTKGLVRGGGKKPWKQKGTGRARAGSIRSPLWRGGGAIFGPQPRDYYYKLPKKVKWFALNSALSAKLKDGELIVIDDIDLIEPKTKAMNSIINKVATEGKVLLVIPEKDDKVELASRNIPRLKVARVGQLNAYDVLASGRLIVTTKAVEKMKEVYL